MEQPCQSLEGIISCITGLNLSLLSWGGQISFAVQPNLFLVVNFCLLPGAGSACKSVPSTVQCTRDLLHQLTSSSFLQFSITKDRQGCWDNNNLSWQWSNQWKVELQRQRGHDPLC